MARLVKKGSGWFVEKNNGDTIGLRAGKWYLILYPAPNRSRIFQYSHFDEITYDLIASNTYLRNGDSFEGVDCYIDKTELETLEETDMRDLLDIMLYNTDKLKPEKDEKI